jgi:putative SOS response-associated peptidase YedK
MLAPNEDVALRIYAVNRYVNDVRRDGPDLIEPLLEVAAGAPAPSTLGL